MPRRRRTPREKKELSLDRDHRDAYGESPHASRKWIPRRKAMHARHWRRRARQDLGVTQLPEGFDGGDALEVEHRTELPYSGWEKQPDRPLRGEVEWRLRQREDEPG
ncbi:hypothetical protein [Conexibacter woesei]|uniref:hypothetical protein n=1 Tax=Conexibacter woesei TaxID=191495 RepID=UPI000425C259|nr:hypothetical protein [Conexibacter woesei]